MTAEQDDAITQEWLVIARHDWKRLRVMLAAEDGAAAGFYLQQTIEKFLKTYLLQRGWQLRKTHELDHLLDAGRTYDAALARFRPFCERVSTYYMVDRYPETGVEAPDTAQILGDLDEAQRLVQVLFPGVYLP